MTIPPLRQPLIDTFLEKNSQINLSAIRDQEGVYIKHILDSIEVAHHDFINQLFLLATSLLDIGTGGGFPLLPLAMHYPHLSCNGIDARKKKVTAVQDIAAQVGITNATLHRGRAEDKNLNLGKFDLVTARGVTYAEPLFDLCFRLTKRKGRMIRRKQFTFEEDATIVELSNDQRIIQYKTFSYTLPGVTSSTTPGETIQRRIYCMQKR